MPLGEPPPISEKESARRYRFLHNAVLAVLLIAFVEFVFLIALSVQMGKVDDSANKAENSADSVHNQVAQVIDQQINSPEAQRQVVLSRQRIINMENKLCGGPCPPAPASSPSIQTESK